MGKNLLTHNNINKRANDGPYKSNHSSSS